MAPRKTSPTKAAEANDLPPCPRCQGTGWVTESVYAGRKRREVGETDAICSRCLFTGVDPTPDRY
ncbi:hypothetical protein GCM10009759_39740 [Kitasatospora saccharophila]|uniref:Small CPxCG-related zinc finger protein n=1 Tax=Kitasatospora saccharophila TaxID=407973 RepID=A0ABN2X493_9ACTN